MTLKIPDRQLLLYHRGKEIGNAPQDVGMFIDISGSSRDAPTIADAISRRMFSSPCVDGYIYTPTNVAAARRLLPAFKRAGWVCTYDAANWKLTVKWGDGSDDSSQ